MGHTPQSLFNLLAEKMTKERGEDKVIEINDNHLAEKIPRKSITSGGKYTVNAQLLPALD